MPIDTIVSLLIAERDKLNRAIETLQGQTKRRGRPPKNPYDDPTMPDWVKPKSALGTPKKHGRKFTAKQRKAQAARMKAYWAAKKKG
jgi:hypothetical protein